MFLRFVVKNFKSFKDEVVLDLTASSIKENESTLLEKNGVKVLPVIGIYGANACGKSNLFKAFKLMQNSVVNISSLQRYTAAEPYIFSNESVLQPSEFEVSISIGDKEYRYGFEKKQDKYISEWLFCKNFRKNTTSKEKLVFYRGYDNFESDIQNKLDIEELSFINSMITSNELILSVIGKRRKTHYSEVYDWFEMKSSMLDYSNDNFEKVVINQVARFIYKYPDVKEEIFKYVNDMDPCIKDLIVEKEDDSDNYILYTKHITENGKSLRMKIDNESSGTKKLISLAIDIYLSVIGNSPLFIDEFDAKLHPLMIRKLINIFNSQSSNENKTFGQLIFTSHNLICLDSKDLRRDEVWFIEKNDQSSSLYSLYDFKDDGKNFRSDLSFGKNYLSGRFGAIPFQEN